MRAHGPRLGPGHDGHARRRHSALPRFLPSLRDVRVVGETRTVIVEAGVYALVLSDLGLSLVASALANWTSHGAGLIVLALL